MATQRCGRCKRDLDESLYTPFYRGKIGTWCASCIAAYKRGEDTTASHQPRNCDQCGCEYVPKHLLSKVAFCSRRCKDKARNAKLAADREFGKPSDRICMHCGEQLPQSMRIDAIFCSIKCNDAAHALQRKLRARTGIADKPGYLRAFICERDRWKCGICRRVVGKDLRHPDPMCASLDHVIPVSEGGTNDVWNLRLTHLRCNLSRRNAGGNEQLAMF